MIKDKSDIIKRIIAILSVLIFILSMVPILYTGRYDFATGDDYAYGALAHIAYINTGSLTEVIKANAKHVVDIYYSHQGTWMSVFLFGFHPEVFGDRAYFLVPWIMTGIMILTLTVFFRYLLKGITDPKEPLNITLILLPVTAVIQFVPTISNAFFWYNGAVHYTVPFALMIISLMMGIKMLRRISGGDNSEKKTGIAGLLIGLSVIYAILGGMSYLAALAAPVGMGCIYVYLLIVRHRKCFARDLWFFLPVALELAGLAVSAVSPGNKVRAGEDFGFSLSWAVTTIIKSFVSSISHWVGYICDEPYLMVLLLIAGAVFLYIYTGGKDRKADASAGTNGKRDKKPVLFSSPLIVILLVWIWNACTYAPEIYSDVEVSFGVDDTYFFMFAVSIFLLWIYILGWISDRFLSDCPSGDFRYGADGPSGEKLRSAVFIGILAIALVVTAVGRHMLADSTSKVCFDFIRKGYGEDFRSQMLLQQKLLAEGGPDVILPSTNAYNGPILNMPVTDEPGAWVNEIVERFYDKESVIGMDADTWHAMYDSPQ